MPSNDDLIGTPMTGNVVMEAITPGKCAAIPAAAMMTLIPRLPAFLENSSTSTGVRCAERAFISNGISRSSSSLADYSMIGKSEVLPMMILTIGFIFVSDIC